MHAKGFGVTAHTGQSRAADRTPLRKIQVLIVPEYPGKTFAELVARLETIGICARIDRGGVIDLTGIERIVVIMPAQGSTRAREIQSSAMRAEPPIQLRYANVSDVVSKLKDDFHL